MLFRQTMLLLVALLLGSCGGGQEAPAAAIELEPLDPHIFLLDAGNDRVELLQPPEGTAAVLEEAAEVAEGDGERQARLDAAVAHLFEASETDEADARRTHLRSASQLARAASRGAEDPAIDAGAAFVRLWHGYLGEHRSLRRQLRRFLRNHDDADAELTRLVHAIEGEIAMGREEWDSAIAAFRNLVGDSEDPFYAYSRYRIAQCMGHLDQGRRARTLLREVRDQGCDADASDLVQRISNLAAQELGSGLRRAGAERIVPATCPEEED